MAGQGFAPGRVVERVLSKVIVSPDGCLLSTYSPVTSGGYRQVGWSTARVIGKELVHRVAWFARHGLIPVGMTVHHKCFRTNCVNADHLSLMTLAENTQRKGGQDWPLGTCSRGHSNDQMVREGKQNVCRPCRKASVDRRRNERRMQNA